MSSLWHLREWSAPAGSRWERIGMGPSILRVPLGRHEILIARFGDGTEAGMALLSSPGSRLEVNGVPVAGGLKVLEHRDEIIFGGERFVFSEECRPEIIRFRAELLGRGAEVQLVPGCDPGGDGRCPLPSVRAGLSSEQWRPGRARAAVLDVFRPMPPLQPSDRAIG